MRALIPSPVPAGTTKHGSRFGQSALLASRAIRCFLPDNIAHIATRGFLLLPSLRIIEYSDNVLIVFSPRHILYHPPALFPDNSITIAAVVIVRAVLFMSQVQAQPVSGKNLVNNGHSSYVESPAELPEASAAGKFLFGGC